MRVGMIIAQDLRPSAARISMSIDQCLGFDLEKSVRLRMDVAGAHDGGHTISFAKQDAATFERVRRKRFGFNRRDHIPCHFDRHRAWH